MGKWIGMVQKAIINRLEQMKGNRTGKSDSAKPAGQAAISSMSFIGKVDGALGEVKMQFWFAHL